jgi:hypothetical protein
LAGEPILHNGRFRLGARVVPGYFSQTHEHPELDRQPLVEVLAAAGLDRGAAMARLRRYELHGAADQWFATLSGGQQARLQILLLELRGATLLLLDEPTDNLDLVSAEALEEGLAEFLRRVLPSRPLVRAPDRFLVSTTTGRSANNQPAGLTTQGRVPARRMALGNKATPWGGQTVNPGGPSSAAGDPGRPGESGATPQPDAGRRWQICAAQRAGQPEANRW